MSELKLFAAKWAIASFFIVVTLWFLNVSNIFYVMH